MSAAVTLVDLVLSAVLIVLACSALAVRSLRQGIPLFISFGLLLALIWARLAAPDLAIAEAAIGAGLTGGLLMVSLRELPTAANAFAVRFSAGRVLVDLLTLILMVVFTYAFWSGLESNDGGRLVNDVSARLPESGVSNPVTAVLLNFRAYDTLLELAVLLAAVLGIRSVGAPFPGPGTANVMLSGLSNWIVPVLIVTGGYVLWAGADTPGGAFQAGAILAAALIMLRLNGHDVVQGIGLRAERVSLSCGVMGFLLVGGAVMLNDSVFLRYPTEWAGSLILVIEVLATMAITFSLANAFAAPPAGGPASV